MKTCVAFCIEKENLSAVLADSVVWIVMSGVLCSESEDDEWEKRRNLRNLSFECGRNLRGTYPTKASAFPILLTPTHLNTCQYYVYVTITTWGYAPRSTGFNIATRDMVSSLPHFTKIPLWVASMAQCKSSQVTQIFTQWAPKVNQSGFLRFPHMLARRPFT
ncbi:hypothetical protein HAX54_037731 [Datura stramonium]|uniref:Uncharacterized protein n=1 Tax=Datura stramonium TaxID=4076 RepID=A0ABS8SHK0_DATST|nr:hypothetical protein [Datura stramonium]